MMCPLVGATNALEAMVKEMILYCFIFVTLREGLLR